MREMSIGEEQGDCIVVSMSWCSCLALHGRSALAILTSDNIISIWASNSDPRMTSSWVRTLTLTHRNLDLKSSKTLAECRIHSFAWAPQLPSVDQQRKVRTIKDGAHPLVVGDQEGNIHLVLITRHSCFEDRSWGFQKVLTHSLCHHDEMKDVRYLDKLYKSKSSFFHDSLESVGEVKGLDFCAWTKFDSQWETKLVCCLKGQVLYDRLIYREPSDSSNNPATEFYLRLDPPDTSSILSNDSAIQCITWQVSVLNDKILHQ